MQIIYVFFEHREHRRGNFSCYYNHGVAWAFVALRIWCVVSGGQKYVQRTSAFPNHSALTFKAVTKLRRDSVSPWRHTFLNSADSGCCFCLYFAGTSCAQNLRTSQILSKWTSKLTNPVELFSRYANHKHFFAEGLHKLSYARNI